MRHVSKPARWLSPSRSEIQSLPADVQKGIGFRLRSVQNGVRSGPGIKAFGEDRRIAHLVKISVDGADTNTYRAAVTVEHEEGVWVIDVFEKRASSGIGTPKKDIDRIADRLKRLEEYRRSPEGIAEIAEMLEEAKQERNDVFGRRQGKNPKPRG